MLKRVTFSGIDQSVRPQELKALYLRYPFVEFAFLYFQHANRKGAGRYPRTVMLKGFRKANLPMAVHICGKLAHDLVHDGDWSVIYRELDGYMDLFSRIQLNIPKTNHFAKDLTFPQDKTILIQLHDGTRGLFDCYKQMPNVLGFQDASGGHGILPETWMEPETEPFGYGGGIGPDNVVEVVRKLNEICPVDYWIDMESAIRTNDKFDIKKCEAVCRRLAEAGLTGGNIL